jgi:hypothetical protein
MTEEGTRHTHRPFFQGYVDSVGNLHGWADGDPFIVNYVGHPMQGAVSGFIWIQNDRRYRDVEFGKNRDYWKSRLRAGAFSWVYSEQSEIGPISEAMIGNTQAELPQQGFVDHVITPAIGMGWLVTEDAVDRYIIRKLEERISNRYYRAMIRGGLNPSRSLANVVGGQWPWVRAEDVDKRLLTRAPVRTSPRVNHSPDVKVGLAPFEWSVNAYTLALPNSACVGGGSTVAFRIHPQWQIVGDFNGCNMTFQPTNWSGDSMNYMVGTRWTPQSSNRWHPYFQVLGGGTKVAQELLKPELKAALELKAKLAGTEPPHQSEYTQQYDTGGWAIAAGVGLDFQINNALTLRAFNAEYTHSWVDDLPHFSAPNGFQVKIGFVMRMGTW